MDLDGNWTDTTNPPDYKFEFHTNETGDLAPEIWVGRIIANVDGDEVQLINDYFQKNHNYRVKACSTPDWPRRALAYVDNLGHEWVKPEDVEDANLSDYYYDFVGNVTNCLEKVYDDVTTIYEIAPNGTNTNAADYMPRLNSTEGYEWVLELSHGTIGWHRFQRWTWAKVSQTWQVAEEDSLSYQFYLNHCPKAYFYIWMSCEAARFNTKYGIANNAIFGNGWGLVSIGPTCGVPAQHNYHKIFEKLDQGECIGEAFKTFWNCTVSSADQQMDVHESKPWVILGDPTLFPSPVKRICSYNRYMQNAKWDSTYWKMLLYNTETYTTESKKVPGLVSKAYLGVKIYSGTTCISGPSVIQVGWWNIYSYEMHACTWDCSEQNVTVTYIRVEIWYKFEGYSWTSMGVAFKTETFNQNTILTATTWTIVLCGSFTQFNPRGPPSSWSMIKFFWGSSTKNSRIENMTLTYE